MIFQAFTLKKSIFRKVTHVIFDLDGILLDTEKVYDQAIRSVAKKFGKTFTPEIRAKVLGRTSEDLAKLVIAEMNLPLTTEEFLRQFRSKAYEEFSKNVDLMPGAERLVRHLHKNNVPLAIATSSTKESYELKISTHEEFFKLFSHSVTGASDSEVVNGKPSPDIFLVCASRFSPKCAPEHCLVFEDAANGVIAARSAGMQAIWVPDEQTSLAVCKDATLILKTLKDFKPELFGLPPFRK